MRKYIAILLLCCSISHVTECVVDPALMGLFALGGADAALTVGSSHDVAEKISDPSTSNTQRVAYVTTCMASQAALGYLVYGNDRDLAIIPGIGAALRMWWSGFDAWDDNENTHTYKSDVEINTLEQNLDALLYDPTLKNDDTLQQLSNEYIDLCTKYCTYNRQLRELDDEERDLTQRYHEILKNPILTKTIRPNMSVQQVNELVGRCNQVHNEFMQIDARLHNIAVERQNIKQLKKHNEYKLYTCVYELSYFTHRSNVHELAYTCCAYHNAAQKLKSSRMQYMPYLMESLSYFSKAIGFVCGSA